MPKLVLYSTVGCHLCEEARCLIERVLGTGIAEQDIVDDERLVDLYGVRIPVLRCLDTGAELDWPFGPEQLRELLKPPV